MKRQEKILDGHEPKCYPFLKWAGGKTQLLPKISKAVPQSYIRYFEPFLGGGAVFFYMISNNILRSEAHLIDSNKELINTYNVIKSNVEELIMILSKYQEEYNKSPVKSYYDLRDKFDRHSTSIEKAARTIALNKTCYNGLYRVNRNGERIRPTAPIFNLTSNDELHANLNFLGEVETVRITALAIRLITYHRTALEMTYDSFARLRCSVLSAL
jgi:DNA adenine methylase Dam